jgi:phosphoglucomutase
MPDTAVLGQSVLFGTLRHRGSAFENSFNEWHILVISQAIFASRKRHDIGDPLLMGISTHALSVPAFTCALEVLAACGLEVMIEDKDEYTPTPVISHTIVAYNRGRDAGLADSSSLRCHTICYMTAGSASKKNKSSELKLIANGLASPIGMVGRGKAP